MAGLVRGFPNIAVLPDRPPNGSRYPLVGGTRERHFDGTSYKPRKLLENAQTPTSRVHAVLGGFVVQDPLAEKDTTANKPNFYT